MITQIDSWYIDPVTPEAQPILEQLQSISYGYNGFGELVSVTNGTMLTTYSYDEYGNLTSENIVSIEEKIGETTLKTYEHDIMGRVSKVIYPDSTATSGFDEYTYNTAGDLSNFKDRNGNNTVYTYDFMGNILTETVDGKTITYTYDLNRNITNVASSIETTSGQRVSDYGTNPNPPPPPQTPSTETIKSKIAITYNAMNLPTAIDYCDGYVVKYEYDKNGNRIKTQLLGEQVLYEYDTMNRVESVTANGLTSNYTYDGGGNTSKVAIGNDVNTAYKFDATNLPTKMTNTVGAESEINTYAYDGIGRQTRKIEKGETTEYIYDYLGRLDEVQEGSKNSKYTYDELNNRKRKTVTENNIPVVESYRYYSNNRLKTISTDTDADTGTGTKFYYDDNGNQTQAEKGTNFAYDANGNQETVTKGTDVETYLYNGRNELVQSNTASGIASDYSYYFNGLRSGKDGTTYIYDGKNILAEIEGTNAKFNVYGNSLLFSIVEEIQVVGGKKTIANIGVNVIYQYNAHGDVTKVLSEAGVMLNSYKYDAFGSVTETVEAVDNTFFYSGYEFDKETGLYYLRSRYYNPETARFTQEDSFNGFYQDPLSLNKYTYAHNNPVTYNDPDGKAIYEESYEMSVSQGQQEREAKRQQEYDEYAAMMGGGLSWHVDVDPSSETETSLKSKIQYENIASSYLTSSYSLLGDNGNYLSNGFEENLPLFGNTITENYGATPIDLGDNWFGMGGVNVSGGKQDVYNVDKGHNNLDTSTTFYNDCGAQVTSTFTTASGVQGSLTHGTNGAGFSLGGSSANRDNVTTSGNIGVRVSKRGIVVSYDNTVSNGTAYETTSVDFGLTWTGFALTGLAIIGGILLAPVVAPILVAAIPVAAPVIGAVLKFA